ncbi:MAG: hypothetical protein ACK401_08570 [Archaeoglobaceae archaeon]
MDEKAVSETMAYMMILGVVLFLISIVYVQVYNTTVDNAEKFKIISMRESFRKIYDVFVLSLYGGASLQQIQLELQGGAFYVTRNATMDIELFNDKGELIDSHSFNLYSLNYEIGDFRISFENGALLEDYYDHRRFVQQPSIYLRSVQSPRASGEMETILVLVLNKIDSDVSVAGSGPIVMVFNSSMTLSRMYPTTGKVNLTVTSDYSELWANYFKDLGGSVFQSGNRVFVEITFNKIVLTVYTTNVTIKKF